MKSLTFIAIISLCSLAQAKDPIAEADKFRSISSPHRFKVMVEDKKSGEVSEFEVAISGKNSVAVQTKPANSHSRKLLMRDEDLWLFSPGSKRPIRVTMDQRLAGDVSNGDILKTDFKDSYTAMSLPESKLESNIEVFDLVKKSEGAAYQKIRYFLDKKSHRPRRAVFYAASGKELKTAEYLKYKRILGQEICVEVEITDKRTHQRTLMKNFDFSLSKFETSYFNKDALTN